MKKIFVVIVSFILISCKSESIDFDYVKTSYWQYDNGFKIGKGDFISFENDNKVFSLKGSIIYFKDEPLAVIKYVDKKNNELIVESIDNQERGMYINVEEFTR